MSEVKVGDELAFNVGYGRGTIEIHKVDAITPSGRIQCGRYTLNPDLSVRGRRDKWAGPYRAEIPTDEHRERVSLQRSQRLSDRWNLADKKTVPKEVRERVDAAILLALEGARE